MYEQSDWIIFKQVEYKNATHKMYMNALLH